jgi:tRNA(Ile)-lysidine synthase TilS/MesJ
MTPEGALQRVVDGIELALTRFPEMWASDARIAFSGGKDSIALAHALAVTGRVTALRAIDMGYSSDWRGRIESIARSLSLPLEIITVSRLVEEAAVDPAVRKDLALRRAFLDGPGATAPAVTPCTNCYNCKIISLVHAGVSESPTILFAHHAQDVLSSFIKSGLMYIDRWEEGRRIFNKDAFRRLGNRVANELRRGHQATIDQFASLLLEGKAQTSEPPMERRTLHGRTYTIARPLFFVDESATAALAIATGARPEGSGCGHTAAAATRTPREIVHHELIPMISETAKGRATLRAFLELVASSLTVEGSLTFDVRGSRHLLLGTDYKGGPSDLADRL